MTTVTLLAKLAALTLLAWLAALDALAEDFLGDTTGVCVSVLLPDSLFSGEDCCSFVCTDKIWRLRTKGSAILKLQWRH